MADDKPKAKRRPAAARPFYLVYTVNASGEIVQHAFSRKTDDILDAVSSVEGAKIEKLTPPAGR